MKNCEWDNGPGASFRESVITGTAGQLASINRLGPHSLFVRVHKRRREGFKRAITRS